MEASVSFRGEATEKALQGFLEDKILSFGAEKLEYGQANGENETSLKHQITVFARLEIAFPLPNFCQCNLYNGARYMHKNVHTGATNMSVSSMSTQATEAMLATCIHLLNVIQRSMMMTQQCC